MLELLIVGLGGFFGAVGRYAVSGWVQTLAGERFPAGTLAVNAIGCLLLGALMERVQVASISPELRLLLTIGFLGSFTTFSTFGYETLEMLRAGDWRMALVNVTGQLLLGLLAVATGIWLVRAVGS